MTSPRAQRLRVLDGRFGLRRATDRSGKGELAVVVLGPDGQTEMRRDDSADDTWAALWNGDDAHDPDATGMLSALLDPLAARGVPVWVASSYDGDLVFVPADRLDEAVEALRTAGHVLT